MLIILYGKDVYRIKRELKKIISKSALKKEALFFSNENFSFDDFRREIGQTSIFFSKKAIILENVLKNEESAGKIKKMVKEMAASESLFVFSEEGGMEARMADFFKKYGEVEKIDALEGVNLGKWVEKELIGSQTKIEPSALAELIVRTGSDLWRIENEVEKLKAYKKSQPILKKDVEDLVHQKAEADIFETIDALSVRDKKRALKLIHLHLEKGDSPFYLLSMINYQFRNILEVKDLAEQGMPYPLMANETGMKPYPFKKSFEFSKRFSLEELKKIYRKLFQIDFKIKRGEIDPKTALDFLVAEI